MRGIAMILAGLLAACSPVAPGKGYTVTGRHGPLVFIVVADSTPRTAAAWQGVVLHACGAEHICNAKIWTRPELAARGFPMTDREIEGIEAAYLINRSTGHDGFICHPFGEAGQRCA